MPQPDKAAGRRRSGAIPRTRNRMLRPSLSARRTALRDRRCGRGRAARPDPTGPDHKESALITSRRLRVPRAHQVGGRSVCLTNLTEPSLKQTLTPPGWKLSAAASPVGPMPGLPRPEGAGRILALEVFARRYGVVPVRCRRGRMSVLAVDSRIQWEFVPIVAVPGRLAGVHEGHGAVRTRSFGCCMAPRSVDASHRPSSRAPFIPGEADEFAR